MLALYDHMLGAPPKQQACPKTQLAGDLDQAHPLPGAAPAPADPDKEPEIKPIERYTVTKVLFGALVVYSAAKIFGFW
jgi:hypothetical protein